MHIHPAVAEITGIDATEEEEGNYQSSYVMDRSLPSIPGRSAKETTGVSPAAYR